MPIYRSSSNRAFTGTTTFEGPVIMANANYYQCRKADGTAISMLGISGSDIAYAGPLAGSQTMVLNNGGGDIQTAGTMQVRAMEPVTDDTYHLGRNDDDAPRSFKSITLKDTSDGKHYRVQSTAGAISLVDLTD